MGLQQLSGSSSFSSQVVFFSEPSIVSISHELAVFPERRPPSPQGGLKLLQVPSPLLRLGNPKDQGCFPPPLFSPSNFGTIYPLFYKIDRLQVSLSAVPRQPLVFFFFPWEMSECLFPRLRVQDCTVFLFLVSSYVSVSFSNRRISFRCMVKARFSGRCLVFFCRISLRFLMAMMAPWAASRAAAPLFCCDATTSRRQE